MQLRYLAPRSWKNDVATPSASAEQIDDETAGGRRTEPQGAPPIAGPSPAPGLPQGPSPDWPDPRQILDSIGETVYEWDIHSDRISWGPNAATVLGFADIDAILTGRAFAERLSHDSESSRYEAIARSTSVDAGKGVPFQIRYGLIPSDSPRDSIVWIEDTGRWFAGPDGRPARAHGLARVITDRHRQQRQLAVKSRFDSLTGVMNRSGLLERTVCFFSQSAKSNQSFAAFLVSLDNLFTLNGTLGYDAADQVIAEVAKRLRENCRERDLVARYAGNKFALLLENCDRSEMTAVAERLIEAVSGTPVETSAGPTPVSLRIGAVVAPHNGRAAHLLFQHAEEALDLARKPGAPRFIAYEGSLAGDDSHMRALRISDEIVSALRDGRILIALQPLIHAATGVPAFYEALMRLRRPDGVLLSPASLLPTAEKSGLIQLIDLRVLELGLKKLSEDPNLRVAVNVSAQTLHGQDYFDRLSALLFASPELARRMTIEITETCVIEDVEATARAISVIKKLGARVAMDDFGAGHTSFRNLRRFDFDLVKIDGAFVQNLSRSADDRFFVRTLVDLARHIGIPVVAEWVEDEETATILCDWGVEYLQGDYFGAAAMPEIDLPACNV